MTMTKSCLAGLFCLITSIVFAPVAAGQMLARGIVYHDVNQNQKLDESDPRLPDIRVSNGQDITTTNDQGQYELSLTDDDIIFLIKPRGWRTLLDEDQLPRFYYIHKPAGSPQLRYAGVEPTGVLPRSIDFPLYSQEEPDKFQTILFGDTQSRNAQEIDYMNRSVIPELIGSQAAFGVTLGDIMFDDLSLYPYHNQSVAMIGIPWYNVLGNHDLNRDTSERRISNETFERWYGPTYYSFDYG
ncbi:MAG: metallophosphoesterase N-terminal domain-containing protein, partial [Pirellulaceae bacterium]